MTVKRLFFVIDETVSIDEDYFMLTFSPALSLFIKEENKSFLLIYVINKSQFQKRVYWRLNDMFFEADRALTVEAFDEYDHEFLSKTKAEIVSYVENENSEAAKFVAEEKRIGRKITDLKEIINDYENIINDSKEKFLKKS